ncbi:MarR family transcriptional regulator [Novosphingobium umbonatum]|uniref:MarR family transcriptional regulator n=1 Tax=Novosphingobium umbonatum TaxID=1908524 RepID=A0A3S2UW82_9SPHN|nr:MarR family transcriptional regulator [Novosphingobium umbonatum]RVU07914.1 MarR family transcriptional regulator [Novosphingobium umbonatum]
MNIRNDELISALARTYLRMYRCVNKAMTGQGASMARTKVLMLVRNLKGNARAADIAEIFDQSPRTITEILDGLERDGLVERRSDPEDRRVKRLHITEAGLLAIEATEPLRQSIINQICAELDDGERAALQSAFAKMTAALEGPLDC